MLTKSELAADQVKMALKLMGEKPALAETYLREALVWLEPLPVVEVSAVLDALKAARKELQVYEADLNGDSYNNVRLNSVIERLENGTLESQRTNAMLMAVEAALQPAHQLFLELSVLDKLAPAAREALRLILDAQIAAQEGQIKTLTQAELGKALGNIVNNWGPRRQEWSADQMTEWMTPLVWQFLLDQKVVL